MDKFENLQTSSESKQYYIPMEVTAETIKDFGINPEDVVWARIGNKPKRVIMIPATEEQYKAFMRPLWREDKREQRLNKTVACDDSDTQEKDKCKEWQKKPVSLDELYAVTEYEAADTTDLEEDVMKKMLIDELHTALDKLEEIDRTIMDMYSNDRSEAEIGQAVGMSQRGVGKRKQRILMKLRTRLQDYK